MAATAILLLHGLLFYGVLHLGARSAPEEAVPIAVRFIGETARPPQWEPPVVAAVSPDIVAPVPQLPRVEIPPVQPVSPRAITIPVRSAPAERVAHADRGAPKVVSSVEYLREPVPRYPPQSRRLREQGLVVLRVLIDEHGRAGSIEIESSSGYARLDDAAREAVERAAFRPYVENGAPRRAFVLIPIEFSLSRASA